MTSQKQYWDKKIKEWSSSSYHKKSKLSLVEKIATYFRSVNKRKDAALKLAGPIAKNKIVIDLGCGLGEFSFGILRYNPKKVIGYDISKVAISEVKKLAKRLKVGNKIEFRISDVSSLKSLPKSDIVVGLGFIDYLTKPQLKRLFKLIGRRSFLFSFFERKISFFNFLHKVYTTIQKCPGAYKYSRHEIRSSIPEKTELYFIRKDGLWFISNIKKFK